MKPENESTDLGALWSRAVDEYVRDTKEDITRFKGQSITDVTDAMQRDAEKFKHFRDGGEKADRVRKAFGNHLDGMQKCLRGIEMVGNAAAAFPPAMPVTIVFAACGRLLGAFASVKAEYDTIEVFFRQSARFFERLSQIEDKISELEPLKAAIVRVFANHLNICGLVHNKTKSKHSRIKSWAGALWNEQDPDFAAAITEMQDTLNEFSDTVGLASFALIKGTQDIVFRVDAKTDEIGVGVNQVQRTQTMIQTDLKEIKQSLARSDAALTKAWMEKSKKDDQEIDKRKQVAKGSAKGDVSDKKFKALKSIKNFFDGNEDVFPGWRDALKENTAQKAAMRDAFVGHTGQWLTSDNAFKQWMDGTHRVIWVDGPEGIGKSLLTYASLRYLSALEDEHASVACFFFKEDFPVLQSAQNALACTVLQVAESNSRYAEHMEACLQDNSDSSRDLATWQRFFIAPFTEASHSTAISSANLGPLYLLFDGLDETHLEQKDVILKFLAELTEDSARVHVLVTCRSEEPQPLGRQGYLSISITKTKMLHDIKLVIKNQLNSLPRLKRFSTAAKKAIFRRVAAKADGMLYVEHILRRFSYIGREGAVRKELERMPGNLKALYRLLLDDCCRNRSMEQLDALKRLFAWLTFSKRSLSLAEAAEVVRLTISKGDFDLEDEIIGRSSRILELSRTRHLDEDAKDELKDDDNEDGSDEHEGEPDEYRNASLTFQERSLRQYFRSVSTETNSRDDLRTPASAAHFTIFMMCVESLMDAAKAGRFTEECQLTGYAVKYWHEHFNELDPEVASEKEVKETLAALYGIVNNDNNVASLFERFTVPSDVYPERVEGTPLPWYEHLSEWVAKGALLPTGSLNANIEAWVSETDTNAKDVLVPLAKAHVRDWLSEYDAWNILEAYRFAEATLKLSGRFHKIKGDPEKAILSVADAFGSYGRDFRALRSIGHKIWHDAYTDNSNDGKEKAQNVALRYLKQSFDMTKDNNFEKGATSLILGSLYADSEDYINAIQNLDCALEAFSEVNVETDLVTTEQLDDVYRPWYLCVLKAGHYANLGKKEVALQEYNKARGMARDETTMGHWLNKLTNLLDEKVDPDGHRLMEALKSWSEKERSAWLEYCLDYFPEMSSLERIYRAAKLSDETELVFDWLTAFGKPLAPRSLTHLNLKAARAVFYKQVYGDVEKAKEALRSALGSQPKLDGSEEYVLQMRMSELRMDLANLIFSQFRASPDVERKSALLAEMKTLPGIKSDDELSESHIGMLIANMLRIVGPARDYQVYTSNIFKTCMDGLEDSVSWNDGASLRLLAKVLGSLDGLEHDARIAISSQFSIMDRTLFEGSEDEFEADDNISDVHKDEDTDKIDAVNIGKNSAQIEQSTKQSTKDGKEGYPNSTPNTPTTSMPSEPQQDLGRYPIFCDGKCGREIKQWSEPLYLCLVCPNTDLCEACYAKRMAWNEPNVDTQAAMTFCGKDHCYIKGPMKGWKGIKDGIIRIGEEKVAVKDWLNELKTVRWARAWERYWLGQGGLKDIDVE